MLGLLKRKKSMKFKFLALTQVGLHVKSEGKMWIHKNDILSAMVKEGQVEYLNFDLFLLVFF